MLVNDCNAGTALNYFITTPTTSPYTYPTTTYVSTWWPLSDADVERIARRVVELLAQQQEKGAEHAGS
jgi:hypothetical protein